MKKLAILLFTLTFLVACRVQAPTPEVPPVDDPEELELTIADFYPFLANTYLSYEGAGMEFAERETYFDFIRNGRAQIRNHTSGTTVVQILEYHEGALELLFGSEEAYYLADYTRGDFGQTREVLLKEPIEVGTKWELLDGRIRTITGINVAIETPAGNYEALEVTTEGQEGTQTRTYYVEGLGMVLSVFEAGEHEVTTALSTIAEDTDTTYILRCYYPDFEKEQLFYRDFDISFNSNDEIETIYTEHLQSTPDDSLLPTLNENVSIQSFFYKAEEELVVVDLPRNYVTEMNLGSGYESWMLLSLVNTIGFNFGVERVVITLDGELYESGHFQLIEGDYFQVNFENTSPSS